MKFLDTHGIPESIRSDQFSGFKGKILKNLCHVGDHPGCRLVERTISTKKTKMGAIFIEKNKRSIKQCLSTIMRDLRRTRPKAIQVCPFQANVGRVPKNNFKILGDKFTTNSDYLDKQQLERSALTASPQKGRIDKPGRI